MEQLCAIIVRINEMFKEMDGVKTNDQQLYGVVSDAATYERPIRSTCPCRGT